MKNTVTILRERLFSIIRRLVEEPERYARKPGRDFTRKRMLAPDVLIYLVLTMDEKSIWKGCLGISAGELIRHRHRLSSSSGRSCFHPRSKICFTGSRIICVRKRNSGATGCWLRMVRL